MPLSDADRDALIRTVWGEARGEPAEGQAAVAWNVLNRLKSGQYGSSVSAIVHAPNQYSTWNNPAPLNSLSQNDPSYKSIGQIVDNVSSGRTPDPTNGALNYYNPRLQAANGVPPPAFASTPRTAVIGNHEFYNPMSAFQNVSDGDVGDVAQSFGEKVYTPVSSGGGITVFVPTSVQPVTEVNQQQAVGAFGGVSQDDINAVAKSFGPVGKAAPPASMQQPATVDIHAPPDIADAAKKRAALMGPSSAVLEGMPIIGPATQAAAAAVAAGVIQPFQSGQPATFSERFSRDLAIDQEAQRQWDAAHPWEALGGNLVGGALIAGPEASTTAGKVLLGLPNATRFGATVGGRFYSGLAGGAALGAADAALRGENPTTGALVGGGLGGVSPLLGEGTANAVEGAYNALGRPAAPLAGVNSIGRNWLATALSNETPASLSAAMERMGQSGFISDVNAPMTELAAGIANRSEPPGSATISEAYRQRNSAQRAVIENALTHSFGTPDVDLEQFRNMITENRAAAADPLYTQWRSMEVQPTPELKALVPRLQQVGAFDEAKYLAAGSGKALNQVFPDNSQSDLSRLIQQVHGQESTTKLPTTETWDLVKRGLDSKIEQAYSAGNKTRASSLIGLKNELISEIGKTPAGQVWNQARSEFADRSELIDQINAGMDTFLGGRSGTSADELKQELKTLSGPELQMRILGARKAAANVMNATRNGDTTLRNKFLAPENQEKLQLLLGNQNADDLVKTLEQQSFLRGQFQYVYPRAGSPTAPRTAAINALNAPTAAPWNPNLTQPLSWVPPSWVDALRPSNVLQGGREAAHAMARQQIAPLLVRGGPTVNDLVSAIRQEGTSRALAARRGALSGAITSGLLSGPGSEAARLRGNFGYPAFAPAN